MEILTFSSLAKRTGIPGVGNKYFACKAVYNGKTYFGKGKITKKTETDSTG